MSTTLSSREFNQDTGAAKRLAKEGPVIITDRGQPTHVLLTIEEYRRLTGGPNILAMLAMPAAADIEFEPERVAGRLFRDTDVL
jgi:PHD/YefM family antitoxin component YafN of YafNO toxin-antitoxin module